MYILFFITALFSLSTCYAMESVEAPLFMQQKMKALKFEDAVYRVCENSLYSTKKSPDTAGLPSFYCKYCCQLYESRAGYTTHCKHNVRHRIKVLNALNTAQ